MNAVFQKTLRTAARTEVGYMNDERSRSGTHSLSNDAYRHKKVV
jgi:hypothetical protein